MMTTVADKRGFTLIECMVVVAVSAMIAYSIYAAMHVGGVHRETIEGQMQIQEAAREALYKMVQEIRLSAPDRVNILNGGTQIQITVPDPGNFVMPDSSVNWNAAHQIQYAYNANDSQIIRTDVTTGATAVIASDVVGLNFAGNGANPNIVTVTVRAQRILLNGRTVPATPLQIVGQAEVRNVNV